jgi:arginine utilization protein RocB
MDHPASPPPAQALGRRTRDIALALTGWHSVNATPGEAAFAGKLADMLRDWPYFAAHPDHVLVLPIEGDPHGRANLIAFVQGQGRRCVTLSGHFDTVPVEDYGELAPLATQPEKLREALVARLGASGAHALARADLASGAYLPGRGLLDMKSGLAAGIAVLEAFAAAPTRDGNLLLIATPDEEDRSVGMRDAARLLPELLRRLDLAPVLGINLDALIDTGDGTAGRVVALGCIGKLLLSALVVGREAHACYPLLGVNAAHLAAELVCALEAEPDLAELCDGEASAPPTALGSRDLKTVYNVTTPDRAWANWNVLTQRRTAAQVLEIASAIATRAATAGAQRVAERAARLGAAAAWPEVHVLDFSTLRARAEVTDPAFASQFAEQAAALSARAELDLPTRCRVLTELTWEAAGLEGPAIVLGFASLPYPAVHFPETPDAAALERRVRDVTAAAAARHGVSITPVRHLEVIVDMSFLGAVDADDLRHTARNTPVWGSSINWPLDPTPTPGIPMINVGPWGRDYHHWLERVHEPYAFGVLPELVGDLCRAALEAN